MSNDNAIQTVITLSVEISDLQKELEKLSSNRTEIKSTHTLLKTISEQYSEELDELEEILLIGLQTLIERKRGKIDVLTEELSEYI